MKRHISIERFESTGTPYQHGYGGTYQPQRLDSFGLQRTFAARNAVRGRPAAALKKGKL